MPYAHHLRTHGTAESLTYAYIWFHLNLFYGHMHFEFVPNIILFLYIKKHMKLKVPMSDMSTRTERLRP